MISPWKPTTNETELKVLGKMVEESGELTSATARCLIQGITEAEPVTGKPNKIWLEDEIADVIAASEWAIVTLNLDIARITERAATKYAWFKHWETGQYD